jgi:F420H(2)-dependent quinone reductase
MLTDGEYAPSPVELIREHVVNYESSNGTEGNLLNGRPVVILTSRGAKTGRLRKVPLMRVEHDGQYAIVASSAGSDKHPGWYYNLLRDPRAQIQDGPVKGDFVAREVTGEERSLWWSRALETWPEFDDYTRMTDREIPVFVLAPVKQQSNGSSPNQ